MSLSVPYSRMTALLVAVLLLSLCSRQGHGMENEVNEEKVRTETAKLIKGVQEHYPSTNSTADRLERLEILGKVSVHLSLHLSVCLCVFTSASNSSFTLFPINTPLRGCQENVALLDCRLTNPFITKH